jgi:hypothetical protein
MSRTHKPLDEVDGTKNMTHQQCHVMRRILYIIEISCTHNMSLTGVGTTL